jgi:hypothetical protein
MTRVSNLCEDLVDDEDGFSDIDEQFQKHAHVTKEKKN